VIKASKASLLRTSSVQIVEIWTLLLGSQFQDQKDQELKESELIAVGF